MWDKETMFDKKEWQYINQPFTEDFRILETTAAYYAKKNNFFTKYFKELKEKSGSIIEQIQNEAND